MGSFASMSCVQCASILWSSTFASMTSIIRKAGLKRLSNFWSPRSCLLLLMSRMTKSPCAQIVQAVATILKESCSVGATSNCQDCEIYVTVENENTPICRRGIFTTHVKRSGERVVLNDELDTLILARHVFSINIILVKRG